MDTTLQYTITSHYTPQFNILYYTTLQYTTLHTIIYYTIAALLYTLSTKVQTSPFHHTSVVQCDGTGANLLEPI